MCAKILYNHALEIVKLDTFMLPSVKTKHYFDFPRVSTLMRYFIRGTFFVEKYLSEKYCIRNEMCPVNITKISSDIRFRSSMDSTTSYLYISMETGRLFQRTLHQR